jgi:hypothetical protein
MNGDMSSSVRDRRDIVGRRLPEESGLAVSVGSLARSAATGSDTNAEEEDGEASA